MSLPNSRQRATDWLLFVLYGALVFCGILAIYSANEKYLVDISLFSTDFILGSLPGKQVLWLFISLICFVVVQFIDRRLFDQLSPVIYGLSIALLLYVMFLGDVINGARSWIRIGPFSLQPSEFSKIGCSLLLAFFISRHYVNMRSLRYILMAIAIIAIPAALIVLQGDTGTAITFAGLILVLYRKGLSGIFLVLGSVMAALALSTFGWGAPKILAVLGGAAATLAIGHLSYSLFTLKRDKKLKMGNHILTILASAALLLLGLFHTQLIPELSKALPQIPVRLVIVGLLGLAMIFAIISYFFTKRIGLLVMAALLAAGSFTQTVDYAFTDVLKPHHRNRINDYLGKIKDPRGVGYNREQSMLAIGSGGLSGKGFLQGDRIRGDHVPEESTDFIFCVIGEETGFLGSAFVIFLFTVLILRCIIIAERQVSPFARYYCYSVACFILMHLLVNIGMTIGLVPVIGIPLPLISYGGSSLLAFSIMIFIVIRLDSERFRIYR